MNNVSKKVIGFIIAGFIIIGVIISANVVIRNYFKLNKEIFYHLNFLQKQEHALNYYILQSSINMYFNNDFIVDELKSIEKEIEFFKNKPFFKNHFPNAYKEFLKYEKLYQYKKDLIFEFQELNAPIKNSTIFLATLLRDMPNYIENKQYYKTAVSLVSNLFLAKQTFDIELLQEDKVKRLNLFVLTPKEIEFHKMFMEHINLFIKYLPTFKVYFHKLLNLNNEKTLQKVFEKYNYVIKSDIKLFEYLSYILVVFIIFLISYLIYTVYALEKRVEEIEYMLSHDTLTQLYNRRKFIEDKSKLKDPALILFNIDKFKYINDTYGSWLGDYVLYYVAKKLKEFIDTNNIEANIYRLGADDFGVLIENKSKEELKQIALDFIEKMKDSHLIPLGEYEKKIYYTPSFSVGIATFPPLLENANMALTSAKHDYKEKIRFFDTSLMIKTHANLTKTEELKDAIEKDMIIPYYQGIYDKNKNIIKYEVLARIKMPDGNIKSIYPYLNIARENKIYYKITLSILKKVKKVLINNNIKLSINLTIEDISNEEVLGYILNEFLINDIAKRVTFEILESEIVDYDVMQEFISRVKPLGVETAIDDFGSGYSNFARILSLNVDYFKIDGSLIKNIIKDSQTRLIIKSIVEYTKKSNKKSVAEYIENEQLFEECKALGIDYFQGFYLDEPSPKF